MNIPAGIEKEQAWKTAVLHSIFGLMFIMAFYFFKERLYADSAYYIFHSIDSGSFVTANQRIVLGISEIISLLAFYSGAALSFILVIWSLSHVLFYYLLFIIVYHVHKNESAGIAIILLQVIGQVWLYYSPMLEICYGAALLVVFSVLLAERKFTPWRWAWLIGLEILVLTSHPENFVLFFFVVMTDVIKNGFQKKLHLAFFGVLAAIIVFKSLTFSEYEGGKLGYMLDVNQNRQYENLLNRNYMSDVLSVFTEHYLALIIMLLLATGAMILWRRWRIFALFYFCLGGLIVLVNATNYACEFTRYNESLYYPLVALVTMTFLGEFYSVLGGRVSKASFLFIIGLSLYQLNAIRQNGAYLKMRTMQMENLIDASRSAGLKKSLVRLENVEKERWVLNWSYPMESLLLSSFRNPSETVSLIADEDYDYRDTSISLTHRRFVLRRWEIRDDESLLPFFQLEHGPYTPLNTADSSVTWESVAGAVSVSLVTGKIMKAYERIFIPVAVVNASGRKIPSLPVDQNYYSVQVASGEKTSTMEIPLDIDIRGRYTEIVSCPLNGMKGPLQLTVRLIIRNKETAAAGYTYN
jgi:hypothetical protein